MNDMVENNTGTTVAPDDTALETAEVHETEPQGESLDTFIQEDAARDETAAEQTGQQGSAPASEPGWMKKRLADYAAKEVAKAQAQWAAEQEARLAPLYEQFYAQQADQLVASGEFKNRDTALEYVRLKNGVVTTTKQPEAKPAEQPRDANGRFTSTQNTQPAADVQARAAQLVAQAKAIKAANGIDVMKLYNENPEVKQRVVSGEWDFADVVQNVGRGNYIPAPMRSANGTIQQTRIANMTDEQFARFDQAVASGRSFSFKR